MKANIYFDTHHTMRYYQENIEQNFEVSVVIPFYKKLEAFKRVFPMNRKYFERNGIEVIIVLDCPDEKEELIEYIHNYPFVNWKIIYNDKAHDWRNPTKPINVGIRFSTKKYVMVCSPESQFYTDAIFQLRESLENYAGHYAIGTVCFAGDDDKIDNRTVNDYRFQNYGSIMVEKKYLSNIKGYDETLNRWGGDDDNIRARLELSGIEELLLPEVKLIHRDNNPTGNARRTAPLDILENLRYPKQAVVNELWGEDFNQIIYDWQNNVYAENLLKKYLSQFLDYELKDTVLMKSYDKILLIPTYNEKDRIAKFFDNNSQYFDAFCKDEKIDSILLNLVHLWDDEELFNWDYPYSLNGITLKLRMFKNIGRTQIRAGGKLHFIPIPYTGNMYHAPILINHYGHLSKEMRKQKYDFYTKEDTENCQKSYDHLIDEKAKKGAVKNILLEDLSKVIQIYT